MNRSQSPSTFMASRNKSPASKRPHPYAPGMMANSIFPPIVAAGILIVANLLALHSMRSKQRNIFGLHEEKQNVQAKYDIAKKHQKIGMLAISMANELDGWRNIPSLPFELLEHLSQLPAELSLTSFRLERPLLLRALTPEQQTPFLRSSLAVAGYASVELSDSGTGTGNQVLPRFYEQTNSRFNAPFTIIIPESEDGTRRLNQWRLSSSLDTEQVWAGHAGNKVSSNE